MEPVGAWWHIPDVRLQVASILNSDATSGQIDASTSVIPVVAVWRGEALGAILTLEREETRAIWRRAVCVRKADGWSEPHSWAGVGGPMPAVDRAEQPVAIVARGGGVTYERGKALSYSILGGCVAPGTSMLELLSNGHIVATLRPTSRYQAVVYVHEGRGGFPNAWRAHTTRGGVVREGPLDPPDDPFGPSPLSR